MTDNSQNNKRIAKNAMMLYIRLFLIMGVNFYMSRVVLQILGVEDLGIYNVVGGIVTMMTFLNSSLNITTQRFMNYEMGKGRFENLNKIFSMSFWSYAIIAIVVLVVCESIGLWFFYEHLNIPENRLDAAFWVYQLSILTFIINLLTVPYTSTIIAHEQMNFYAYLSIGDVILKLTLLYVLSYINHDKLTFYAILMCAATLFIWFCNWIYCRMKFNECKLRLMWDSTTLKKLLSFSAWNSVGAIASSVNEQGVNILINIFFNSALNGARAIAYQVKIAINSFAANFLTAVRPQLFKSYAEGKLDYMNKLVFSSTKFSIYLLLILILPILFNTEYILDLWLDEITPEMVSFTQLVIISVPVSTCFPVLANVSQATGKIKWYQISASIMFIMIPVCTYILYKCGMVVEWAFIMTFVWDVIGLAVRLIILKKDIQFPIGKYMQKAILPPLLICIIVTSAIAYPITFIRMEGWQFLILSSGAIITSTLLCIWLIGLEKYEKQLIGVYIAKIIKHRKR